MQLSKQERETADLYTDLHALMEPEHAKREAGGILTAEHLEVPPDFLEGKRCLDAGVGGKGRALKGLFKLGSRDITAIDLSATNLKNAREANQDIAGYVKFEVKNLLELDYPEGSYDFIHCNGVIHHTEYPEKAVRQLYRCLSPGGMIYVGLYGKGGVMYGAAGLLRLVARRLPYKMASYLTTRLFRGAVAGNILDYLYVPYQFHYTEQEAKALLSGAGFVNIKRLKQTPPLSRSVWDSVLKPSTIDPKTLYGRIMVGSGWIILTGEKSR